MNAKLVGLLAVWAIGIFALSITPVFAQEPAIVSTITGEDFTTIIFDDKTATTIFGQSSRVLDNQGDWQNYIYNEDANTIQIETGHGSVSLSKSTCGFSYFNAGRINENSTALFSDSIIARMATVDTDIWQEVAQVNNAECQASWDGSELTASKLQSGVGLLEYKYINQNGKWKTQLEATNLSSLTDKKFGFTQTIDLNRDAIQFGGSQRNLDDFDGTTFDRAWLENNDGRVINLLNGMNFDFDISFDRLWAVSIYDTGNDSSKLAFDFTNDATVLLPNQTLILDPTFTYTTASTIIIPYMQNTGGSACSTVGDVINYGGVSLNKRGTGDSTSGSCRGDIHEWDISQIPDGSTITNSLIRYDTNGASNMGSQSCEFVEYDLATQPSTYSNTPANTKILHDVLEFGSSDVYADETHCRGTTSDNIIDMGANGDTHVQDHLDDGWFAIGVGFGNWVRGGSQSYVNIGGFELEITYTLPPVPNNPTDLSLDLLSPTSFNATWTNTGDSTFQGVNTFLNGTNSIVDLGADLISHFQFDGNLTDTGFNSNDLTLTSGSEQYGTGQRGGGFYFNGVSYLTGTTETDYDFDYDDIFTIAFYEHGDPSLAIFDKRTSSTGYFIRSDAGIEITFQVSSGNTITCNSTTNPDDSKGQHWVIVSDGTNGNNCDGMSIFLNGTSDTVIDNTVGTIGSVLNNANIVIGADRNGNAEYVGFIDNFMILDIAMTPTQVSNVYDDLLITDTFQVFTGLTQDQTYEMSVCSWGFGGYNSTSCASDTITTNESPDGTTSFTSLVVGDVLKITPKVSITNGVPAPEITSLKIYRDNTLIDTITVSQTIAKGASYTFTDDLAWYQFTNDSTYEFAVVATATNTASTETLLGTNSTASRTFAPASFEATTTALGYVNYTINTSDPANRVLTVNRPINDTGVWDIGCYSVTGFNEAGATWYNGTDVGFFNPTLSASSGQNVYLTCYNPPLILFSTVSYGNLTGVLAGFSGFDDQLGSWFGLPMIFMFVFFIAGLFGGRQSGTSMVITLAVIAILGGIGLIVIEEALWGIMLVLGALGLFASRVRF